MATETWDRVRLSRASDEIVSQFSQALFDGRLQPGQVLGVEADLAERFGVSRSSVREAMRTLEASGIVEIGMGPKGGARIAQGDPKRFAHALAVQLRLVGVTAGEVLDVRVGVEWMGAQWRRSMRALTSSTTWRRSSKRPDARASQNGLGPWAISSMFWSPRPLIIACWSPP